MQRDRVFDREFELADSITLRHLIGRLLGRDRLPCLNAYRDHLLAGHAIGALPVHDAQGVASAQEEILSLATKDHDGIAGSPSSNGLQSLSARRAMQKLLMDLQAGKVPLVIRMREL